MVRDTRGHRRRRVNAAPHLYRRTDIRIVRLWASTKDVETFAFSGWPMMHTFSAPTHSGGLQRR